MSKAIIFCNQKEYISCGLSRAIKRNTNPSTSFTIGLQHQFLFLKKKRLHQTLRVEQKSMNKEHEPISIGADISQRLSSSFGQGSSRKIQFQ